jgi:2-oxoglutarate ferredoxin oxidoreductase subunit beta
VVTVGEHGVTEKDILVHDAKRDDPTMAFMLANLALKPGFPTPIGIFRDVSRPTAEDLTWDMINAAKAKKGDVDVVKLLSGGDTWMIK